MKLHSFHELLTRIAHLSTRDGKPIAVTFGGKDAYCTIEHGRIRANLPALESGTVLTPHEFSIWMGYGLHECACHPKFTDINLYLDTVKSKNNPTFSTLLNWFEDVYSENADINLYPGDRKYLDSTHQYCDDQIPAEKCQNPQILGLIYKEAYTKYRNLDTKRLQGELATSYPQISAAMLNLASCKSTSDCIKLAEKILALIPKENKENKENNPQENQDEDENSQSSNNLSNPKPELNNGTETNSGPNKNKSDNTDNCNSQPENKDQENKNDLSLTDQAQAWNTLTEIKNLIQVLTKDQILSPPHTGDLCLPPLTLSLDKIFVPGKENLVQYLSTRAALTSQITALKKMFRIYLQSKNRKSWLRGLDEGPTLDLQRLHLVPTSNSVFKSPHDKYLINTAVELMLDLSASMTEELVRSAAIILAEALSTIPQIKLDICGFKTQYNPVFELYSEHYIKNIGRLSPMEILLFKEFSEPYIKSRARLGGIETTGSTPLGDAYGKALERLVSRSEPRRIIFLVTDGKPQFQRGNSRHNDYILMSHVHSKAKSLHIETIGLDIGRTQTPLESHVDKYLRISSINELPQALMQILKEIVR